jgi:hypothetical protein
MTTPSDVTRPVDGVAGRPEHLRCPFSSRSPRLAELMTACPGFEPQQVCAGLRRDAEAATVTTCHHLQAVPARRGRFIPACQHPETWVVEAAGSLLRAAALDPVSRARSRPAASRLPGVEVDEQASSRPPVAHVLSGGVRVTEPAATARQSAG